MAALANKATDEDTRVMPSRNDEDGVRNKPGELERGYVAADSREVKRVEKVYRRIDRRIIPPFWLLYFVCTAIRSNVGLAQTMNEAAGHDLAQVLSLSPKQVSTGLALFYVAYVIFEFPSNLIMTRLSPRGWMSRIVLAVGIIGMCFAAIRAAWSLYLLRFLLGMVTAGMWPGMVYYLTLFYPPSRMGKRIGMCFTSAQVSAAVVGLISAGFQKMDGLAGLAGFQWMFLLYGLCAIVLGFTLLWWLPDRPLLLGEDMEESGLMKWLPAPKPILVGEDALVHYKEMARVYHPPVWNPKDLAMVLTDWRLWPLVLMAFGVLGVGVGTQLYGTVIISSINASFTGTDLSLLFAPIWIMDLLAILLITPLSDRYHRHRALFFSISALVQIAGLLATISAPTSAPWLRYAGLLLVGLGLGPTVPICMTWTSEIFQARHGEVGVAAASALVSGLGNLGSITTTYALYTGWPSDAARGPMQYRRSNLVMVGILGISIASSVFLTVMLRSIENRPSRERVGSARAGSSDDFDATD